MRILYIILAIITVTANAHAITVHEVEDVEAQTWLIEDNTLPIISLSARFAHAGAVSDTDALSGRASLAAQMLLEGAGEYDARAFGDMLDFHAISLNASAGRDDVTITLNTLTEHADIAFELLGIMLRDPHVDAEDVDRIRAEHLRSLEQLQERPSYLAGRALHEAAFAGHAYARSVYGTADSINRITPKHIQDYYRNYLGSNVLEISVSGDISPQRLGALLNKALDGLQHDTQPINTEATTLHITDKPVIVTKTLPQTEIRLALPALPRQSKNFYASYMMNHIVGGSGLSSQLSEILRHKHGLTYSVGSGITTQDYAHWLGIGFATKQESAGQALELVRDALTCFAKEGFSQKQLDLAQQNIIGQFPLNIDSNSERVAYLSLMQKYDLGQNYLDNRNDYMAQVTLEDVNNMAATLLNTPPLVVIVGEYDE